MLLQALRVVGIFPSGGMCLLQDNTIVTPKQHSAAIALLGRGGGIRAQHPLPLHSRPTEEQTDKLVYQIKPKIHLLQHEAEDFGKPDNNMLVATTIRSCFF